MNVRTLVVVVVVVVVVTDYVDLQDVPNITPPLPRLGNGCDTDMPTGRTHLELS
jgi:hypothetical protein